MLTLGELDMHLTMNRFRNGGVYFVQGEDGGPVKIGFSRNGAEPRLKALQCGSPVVLKLLAWIPAPQGLERALHAHLSEWREHGEWFEPVPELFEAMDHLLEHIPLGACP